MNALEAAYYAANEARVRADEQIEAQRQAAEIKELEAQKLYAAIPEMEHEANELLEAEKAAYAAYRDSKDFTVETSHERCDDCVRVAQAAIGMARATGSVAATHEDGWHKATATRN